MRRPGLAVAALLLAGAWRPAVAGPNDLNLLHLCDPKTPAPGVLNGMVSECGWVRRATGTGLIESITPDAEAESRFRSLMSELGVLMAPRLSVPAETLGLAGFQISGEAGTTSISRGEPFWNGVEAVSPDNRLRRPDGWLTTVGLTLRKGLWLPLPALEVGGGFMHLVDSKMVSWQGYAKLALHEGFHDWPLPSFAVRGSAAILTGTDQVRMSIAGLDLLMSKGFGILKTARLEPFGGWSFLFVRARANPVDATPSCDAYFARTATAGQPLGDNCAEAQRGTDNDFAANFAFSPQDVITRHRFFGGAKLKFATVFMVAQYAIAPAGRSRDESKSNGARDGSGKQESLSLSAGFDF